MKLFVQIRFLHDIECARERSVCKETASPRRSEGVQQPLAGRRDREGGGRRMMGMITRTLGLPDESEDTQQDRV